MIIVICISKNKKGIAIKKSGVRKDLDSQFRVQRVIFSAKKFLRFEYVKCFWKLLLGYNKVLPIVLELKKFLTT